MRESVVIVLQKIELCARQTSTLRVKRGTTPEAGDYSSKNRKGERHGDVSKGLQGGMKFLLVHIRKGRTLWIRLNNGRQGVVSRLS